MRRRLLRLLCLLLLLPRALRGNRLALGRDHMLRGEIGVLEKMQRNIRGERIVLRAHWGLVHELRRWDTFGKLGMQELRRQLGVALWKTRRALKRLR